MESLKKFVIVTLVITIIAGAVWLISSPGKPTEIEISAGTEIREKRIGVFGAVASPGYYSYEGEIRIREAAALAGGLTEEADMISANLEQWVNDGETVIIPTSGPLMPTLTLPVPDEQKVDLNSATLEELMSLPGIGEKRARDIISLREKKGRFESPEEILEISGISENLLKKIIDRLIVR